MRLPEIQKELRQLAFEYDIGRLGELADEMTRRRHGENKPRRKYQPFNTAEAAWVRARHAAGLTYDEIIAEFFATWGHITNTGRISELLFGKRK